MAIPIDKNDHGLDALRYEYSYDSTKRTTNMDTKAKITNYARELCQMNI